MAVKDKLGLLQPIAHDLISEKIESIIDELTENSYQKGLNLGRAEGFISACIYMYLIYCVIGHFYK
jgi:hypothetical protein